MKIMSNVSRGLFDPRVKSQLWPEPADDPNIPYAWGEGGLGYAISGYRPNESPSHATNAPLKAAVVPFKASQHPKEPLNEKIVSVAVASSIVLGAWGLIDGYSQSQNTGGERVFDSLEKAVIYATGVGFLATKLRG